MYKIKWIMAFIITQINLRAGEFRKRKSAQKSKRLADATPP